MTTSVNIIYEEKKYQKIYEQLIKITCIFYFREIEVERECERETHTARDTLKAPFETFQRTNVATIDFNCFEYNITAHFMLEHFIDPFQVINHIQLNALKQISQFASTAKNWQHLMDDAHPKECSFTNAFYTFSTYYFIHFFRQIKQKQKNKTQKWKQNYVLCARSREKLLCSRKIHLQ